MIIINGEKLELQELALADYLKENGYEGKRIAVECNEAIIPRARLAETVLHGGDVVEIVSFVGGG